MGRPLLISLFLVIILVLNFECTPFEEENENEAHDGSPIGEGVIACQGIIGSV